MNPGENKKYYYDCTPEEEEHIGLKLKCAATAACACSVVLLLAPWKGGGGRGEGKGEAFVFKLHSFMSPAPHRYLITKTSPPDRLPGDIRPFNHCSGDVYIYALASLAYLKA